MKGYIHSFESLAAVDGEGLRCAVFLVGCPLRCVYCHNPDTWNTVGAIETEPDALVKKLSRYKPYFKNNGGVTFSGGEPLLQAEFIRETVPLLQNADINYIIDTSGSVKLDDTVKYVLNNAQSILLDLKFWDDESYLRYTGKDINDTLNMLEYLESIQKNTCVRTVIVPNINDNEETLQKYIALIKRKSCVKKYELLPFHTMGFHKYESLGIRNPLINTPSLESDVKDKLQSFVNQMLFIK